MQTNRISGSTTIVELMRMFPDGRATALMGRLGWPCAHCGARGHEALSLAAKRHGNPPQAVIARFRALAGPGPSEAEFAAAATRHKVARDPIETWKRSAARYGA